MSADVVDELAVYACTGNPLPRDIEAVATWLFNDSFAAAYQSAWPCRQRSRPCGTRNDTRVWEGEAGRGAWESRPKHPRCLARCPAAPACVTAEILKLQTDKGVALVDIVRELHP